MTTTPDFRAELQRLVDLYEALGGNWSPHGYTDTWNDALAAARAELATPLPAPPLDEEILELAGDAWISFAKSQPNPQRYSWDLVLIRAALERWGDAYPTR